MNKRQEIVKILTVFSEMYDKSLSEDYTERYVKMLEVYPSEKIKQAADHIVATKKFHKFPLPAEFIEFLDPPEQAQIKANEAWRTLLYAFERYGYYHTVQFVDAAITQTVIAMGGWLELYNRYYNGKDGEMWTQKEFEQRYTGYFKMPQLSNEVLIGWCDTENDEKNPVPVLIGQPVRKQIEQVDTKKEVIS